MLSVCVPVGELCVALDGGHASWGCALQRDQTRWPAELYFQLSRRPRLFCVIRGSNGGCCGVGTDLRGGNASRSCHGARVKHAAERQYSTILLCVEYGWLAHRKHRNSRLLFLDMSRSVINVCKKNKKSTQLVWDHQAKTNKAWGRSGEMREGNEMHGANVNPAQTAEF